MRSYPTLDYILVSDLDMSGYPSFVPIGTSSTPFTGTFDGNGYTISNLTIGSCASPSGTGVGLFGDASGATFQDLHLENVNVVGDDSVGALVGLARDCTITNCSAVGTVSGRITVGGLVGFLGDGLAIGSWAGVDVSQCDTYETPGKWHGGFVGHAHPHTNPGPSGVGNPAGDGCVIQDCYATGSVTGRWAVGGFSGNHHGSLVENSYAVGDVIAEKSFGGGFTGYLQVESGLTTTISDCWSAGSVTSFGQYLETEMFSPALGFDIGRGLVSSDGGFVGWAEGLVETVDDEEVVRAVITGCDAYGSVEVCASDDPADPCAHENSAYAAGFAGYAEDGTFIEYSTARGDVLGGQYPGGFVAWGEGRIDHCEAYGNVRGDHIVGGFVGGLRSPNSELSDFDGYISNSVAHGNAYGYDGNEADSDGDLLVDFTRTAVGGFVGQMYDATRIEDSVAYGASYSNGEQNGGFAGSVLAECYIERCEARGPVIAEDSQNGGFVGARAAIHHTTPRTYIQNSLALGTVVHRGDYSVGTMDYNAGFIGRTQSTTTINWCYSAGYVAAINPTSGGFAGSLSNTAVLRNYWDLDTSGQNSSVGATGLTTAQMMQSINFTGWDFVTVWDIQSGVTYPYLR